MTYYFISMMMVNQLFNIYIKKIPNYKNKPKVIFIECTEFNSKHKDANGLCVAAFSKNMGWSLGDIEKLHNDEFIK